MPNPICLLCRKEMKCEKNELIVHDQPEEDYPATYWMGDVFKCSECGSEIVIGFGRGLTEEQVDTKEAVEFHYG